MLGCDDTDLKLAEGDPLWALCEGYVSPQRPSQKNEPHTVKKVLEKRFRIICCPDLTDQIVERVLGNAWNRFMKAGFPEGVATVGNGCSDRQIHVFGEMVRCNAPSGRILVNDDMSGFDTKQTQQLMQADNDVRIMCCSNADKCLRWQRAIRLWVPLKTNCVYAMPDGALLAKDNGRNVLPSGSYETTAKQTGSRHLLNAYVNIIAEDERGHPPPTRSEPTGGWLDNPNVSEPFDFVKIQGDDCLEVVPLGWTPQRLFDAYLDTGFPLKEVPEECTPTNFKFCSHHYQLINGVWYASLITWAKSLFGLFTSAKPTLEQIASIHHELRHNTELITSDRYVDRLKGLIAASKEE